jgi:predicted dehydrogenase
MTIKKLNFGIIGIGWWSDVLAERAKKSNLFEITACFSRDQAKCEKFVNQFGGRSTNSLEELVSIPGIDGVIITTPNSSHLEVVKIAARAKKHIFLEKPIANEISESREIEKVCREAGIVLSVGHSYRRHKGIRQIFSLIKDDSLGRISLAEGIFSKDHGLRLTSDKDWRFLSKEVPAGCLMQIGIHHIDNLIYLLGDIEEVSSMFARLETKAEINDVGSVLLRFKSGAIGFVCADYISVDRFELTVSGTKGIARFDLKTGLSVLMKGENTWRLVSDANSDYLLEELDEFARCVTNSSSPEVGAHEAIKALSVIHAAIKSNKEKRVVSMSEITSFTQ